MAAMMSEREVQLSEELRLARLEIQLLKVKLDALARRVFGKSSERLDLQDDLLYRQVYVQIDETPVEYLAPGNGQTKTGYLWVVNNPASREVLFTWHTSRAAVCLHSIVPPAFEGVIQCDGYSAYDAFAASRLPAGSLQLAGCWAHARRAFFEAREHTKDAAWVLGQIQLLYGIEAELREARAGPDERRVARQAQSRPLIEALHHYLRDLQTRRVHLPQSLMGKATRYALNQWESLGVYLEDGRVEIDSNGVENAIRPSAIGNKNWLFIGDAQAGARAATFYTLMANCRAQGVDAYAYLENLFTHLPAMINRQVHTITPSAWAGQHQADQQAASAQSGTAPASTP